MKPAGYAIPLLRRFLAIWAAVMAVSFSPAAEPGSPIVARYAGPEVSAAGASWSAAQTANGQLHFGFRQLLTFDGERWSTAAAGQGWGIKGLEATPDGRLWATAAGEIGWFAEEDGNWRFHSLKDKLPPEHAAYLDYWQVFAHESGVIFFLGTDRVLRWDGNKFSIWMLPAGRRFFPSRVGQDIYIYGPGAGLYRLDQAGPTQLLTIEELGDDPVHRLERSSDGWLMIRNQGLFHWDGAKTIRKLDGKMTDEIVRRAPLTITTRLPDGRLALGSTQHGAVLLSPDGKIDTKLDQSIGITEGYISLLFVDRQGSLWVGGDSSLFQVRISSFSRLFDQRSALAGLQVTRITKQRERLVFVTYNNAFELSPDLTTFRILPDTGDVVHDARGTSAGLLVGAGRSLVLQENGVTQKLRTGRNSSLLAPSRTHPSRLLLGEERDIFEISPQGEEQALVKGLPDYALALADDLDDGIWIGTYYTGVLRADRKTGAVTVPDQESTGIPNAKGRAHVATSTDGSVYAFTSKSGWYRKRGADRFERIANFPDADLAAIASDFDANDDLWAITLPQGLRRAAVGRISLRTGRPVWEPHSVEGLPEVGAPRCIFPENNPGQPLTLWIGGTNGVVRNVVAGSLNVPQPLAPAVRAAIRSVGSEATHEIAGAVPYSTQSIEFTLSEFDFAHRSQLRLETRIDNLDTNWLPLAGDSRRLLSGLRDGSYVFRARAIAETGAVSPETTFAFAVAPPWWRTVPVLLAAFVALFPAAYGIHLLRLRRLQRSNRDLEQKVRDRTDELERASAAKTEFVANMSHDIRNPLNGIVGLSLALEDSKLDPKQRELVSTLRECTTYLSSLVDDVLDFASIEAGKIELRPGPFEPAELLRSVVTTLKSDTAERGATLHIEVDPAVPAVIVGDAGRIQQILVNYASNALKYAGGRIELVATLPIGSADEVEFSVVDHGSGISAEERATLFTKFGRLSASRHAHIPGTGLGLASCRALADIMSGSVGVESEVGHGARFYLRLPLTSATLAATPIPEDLPNTAVLLVEDTDYNAMAATAVLARLGLACDRARNGAEALQLFAAKRYKLVLLDRNLPDMDGLEVARQLRTAESDGIHAVVLAVTAYCTAEDKKLCLEAGMDTFVGKPLTPEKLRRAMLEARERLLPAGDLEASAPAKVSTPPGALDTSLLNYLSDGTAQGLHEQVDRYVSILADAQQQLLAAEAAGDFEATAHWAHRLLGQARMIDGTSLVEIAVQLERAARAADALACRKLIAPVTREVLAIMAALRPDRPSELKA